MQINDLQYVALKTLAEELVREDGVLNVDRFLAEIDRRVALKQMPRIFTATKRQIYEEYRHELVRLFVQKWEEDQQKYWIGVDDRHTKVTTFYPLDDSKTMGQVSSKAKQQYVAALTMLRVYGPYAGTWGADIEQVEREVTSILTLIKQTFKKPV